MWWPEEIHLPLMLFLFLRTFRRRHMAAVCWGLLLIKYGRIITAVEVDVRLHESVVGKNTAAITEQHLQYAVALVLSPFAQSPGLKHGGQAEAAGHQQQQEQD